jgi:hypothetical protein
MKRCLSRFALVACGALACLASNARAAEPAADCPEEKCPAARCPALGEVESILTKLPYLNRLFHNVVCPGDEGAEAASATPMFPRIWRMVGPDGLERIGVDFDIQVVGAARTCSAEECTSGACPAKQCPAARCAGNQCVGNQCVGNQCAGNQCPIKPSLTRGAADCAPSLQGQDGGGLCPAAPLPLGPSSLGLVGPYPAPVAISPPWGMPQPAEEGLLSALEDTRRQFDECERELLLRLADARVEAATAKTKMKAQQELASKEAAYAKELLAAQLENAKLAAKLELFAEKEKLASELRQAQSELTVLKAQLEVAALKARLADRQLEEETATRPTIEVKR